MGLETGTYISDLNSSNPVAGDPVNEGDDHIRLVKSTVKATFPSITGAVSATHTELNLLDGVTANTAELNYVDVATLGTAEASKAVTVDASKDSTGIRNLTITGELDGATLDISGNADIDGTLEADAITIGGVSTDTLYASPGFAVAMAIAL